MLIRVIAKVATKINPFFYSVHSWYEFAFENILQLYLLNP